MAKSKPDCPVSPTGKHQRGTRGCGCPDDPDLARKLSDILKGGSQEAGKKGHTHVYKPNGTRKVESTERRGLRKVRIRTTYYFERCDEPGCDNRDRVTTTTEDL